MTPGQRLIELFKIHADGRGGFDMEAIALDFIREFADVPGPQIVEANARSPLLLEDETDPRPHERSWIVSCRVDQHGLTVLDCACGARKRLRRGPAGDEEVALPLADTPLGDVLFDKSLIQ